MLLQKLKLVNFRQFYGNKTVIEFSTDSNKNITLIHGENGVGKTTILNAILWCLYEKITPDFEQPHELICLQAIKEGKADCTVELSFEYEGKNYNALRNFKNSGQVIFKLHEVESSNYAEVPNQKAFINNILPEDMAEYFFFHGEGVSNINARQPGEKFRRAIRSILGFNLAETAIEDLKDINKRWTKELAELQNVSKHQSELILKKKTNEERLEVFELGLVKLMEDKEIYGNDLEEVLEALRNHSHEDAKNLQHQVDDLTKRNANLQNKIRATKTEKQNLIKKYGVVIFGQKLARQALDFIDEQSLKAKLPAPYDRSLVTDLVERGYCICGRELKKGTAEFEKVTSMIEKSDNAVIRNKLKKATSCGSAIKSRLNDFLNELASIDSRLSEQDAEKRDIEAELADKQKAFSEIKVEEIQKLEFNKSACQEKISITDQEIGSKKRNIEIVKNERQDIEAQLRRSGAEDARIEGLTECQHFAQNLVELCSDKLRTYEEESKITIASKVNETLQEFSRKDFKVKVDNEFAFHLVREDGQRVAKSKGENLLLNLAFVSALIEFAQMRKGANGDFLVSGTTAPFVIDAPFGELDNTYKRATAEFLPKRSKQLILLLSSSHWSGEVDETIKNRIGSEYVLISSKSSPQNGKPEDKLTIGDKVYIQSLYNQDKDATFIERVG
jgi:DNA sulfur modification protein DndD